MVQECYFRSQAACTKAYSRLHCKVAPGFCHCKQQICQKYDADHQPPAQRPAWYQHDYSHIILFWLPKLENNPDADP